MPDSYGGEEVSITVHSNSSNFPRYRVTQGYDLIHTTNDGSDAVQYAIDHANGTPVSIVGTIEVGSNTRIEGCRFFTNPKTWYRICCRCGGAIFKGEGKILEIYKNDIGNFYCHKKYSDCQKMMYGE